MVKTTWLLWEQNIFGDWENVGSTQVRGYVTHFMNKADEPGTRRYEEKVLTNSENSPNG